MKIVPPQRNSESNKRSSEDVMKIVPPLRNSESNKRSSEDVMKIRSSARGTVKVINAPQKM